MKKYPTLDRGIYKQRYPYFDAKYLKEWREEHKIQTAKHNFTQRQRMRDLTLLAYGGENPTCRCCGLDSKELLCVDHVSGGGNIQRRAINGNKHNSAGSAFYYWLLANKFPAGFQLLCHNCNFFKTAHPKSKCPCIKSPNQ